MRIGVIADTHGRVPAGVHAAFAGVSLILHAGDIDGEEVVAELEGIARVVAVRGNVDRGLAPPRYPDTRRLTLEGVDLFLCHQPARAAGADPAPDVVVHGHTHEVKNVRSGRTLWLNPGAAGPPPSGVRVRTVAVLTLGEGEPTAEIVELD